MRVAVYGAGALGGYYGARLAEAGHEVALIARGEHLAAIRSGGLHVTSPAGDSHLTGCLATDEPGEIGPVDLVIVAVKTWQIPEVAAGLAPLVAGSTAILPFLNGVEAPDQLAAAAGPSHVLGGLSRVFALIEAPGRIRHFSASADVEIGELDGGASERAEALCRAFESASIEASAVTDVRTALWRKLLMVSSWAGLGALSRSPIGVVRAHPETRALVDRAMDEGIAVGRARGHDVDASFKRILWDFYDALPPDATASMMRDVVAGRPSELEAWNGAIVRLGEALGVDTPVHAFTYHALLPMERRARGEAD